MLMNRKCNILGHFMWSGSSLFVIIPAYRYPVYKVFTKAHSYQGSNRLEKYLNLQDYLEKSLKIKFALKST